MVAMTLMLTGIAAYIRAMLERQIPVGYQDENGFHMGTEPARR